LIGIVAIVTSVAALFAGQASLVGAATTVVDRTHMAHWVFNNDDSSGSSLGTFINGPGSPPGGAGRAQFTVDSTAGEILMTPQFAGTPLSSFTTLAYSTYGPNSTLDASLQFDLDYDLTASGCVPSSV
jgi:hypothetical protein